MGLSSHATSIGTIELRVEPRVFKFLRQVFAKFGFGCDHFFAVLSLFDARLAQKLFAVCLAIHEQERKAGVSGRKLVAFEVWLFFFGQLNKIRDADGRLLKVLGFVLATESDHDTDSQDEDADHGEEYLAEAATKECCTWWWSGD